MRRCNKRASVPIEFALTAPIVLALIFGLLDWSQMLLNHTTLVLSVRRGARAVQGVHPDRDPAAIAVATAASWAQTFGLNPSGVDFSAEIVANEADGDITVNAVMPFTPFVGLLPVPDTLSASCTAVYYGDLY